MNDQIATGGTLDELKTLIKKPDSKDDSVQYGCTSYLGIPEFYGIIRAVKLKSLTPVIFYKNKLKGNKLYAQCRWCDNDQGIHLSRSTRIFTSEQNIVPIKMEFSRW